MCDVNWDKESAEQSNVLSSPLWFLLKPMNIQFHCDIRDNCLGSSLAAFHIPFFVLIQPTYISALSAFSSTVIGPPQRKSNLSSLVPFSIFRSLQNSNNGLIDNPFRIVQTKFRGFLNSSVVKLQRNFINSGLSSFLCIDYIGR